MAARRRKKKMKQELKFASVWNKDVALNTYRATILDLTKKEKRKNVELSALFHTLKYVGKLHLTSFCLNM